MNKRKKKKGASLVVVIVVTSMIFILAVSILGMVGVGYKARINESENLQNLYESDSGLDVVYNIIRKTSQAAIIDASANPLVIAATEANKNGVFKEEFLKFIGTDQTTALLENCISNWKIPKIDSDGKVVKDVAGIPDLHDVSTHKDVVKEIMEYNYDDTNKKIDLKIKSTFKSIDGGNTKVIIARFVVNAPEYQEIKKSDGTDVNQIPILEDKIICTDGDVEASGTITVDGDIWAQGQNRSATTTPRYAFDKYLGGILLKNCTLDSTGNIYTSKTFNLETGATANIHGDIYALNAYLGKTTTGIAATKNRLTVSINGLKGGNLITNNDLTLNSPSGEATMVNYYGINSKKDNDTKNLASKNSSCIIVNNDTSSLNISNDAYIMGLAYIDTKGETKYQTAESVAVKGNYAAYTDPMGKDVALKYYEPLQLIENMNLIEKQDHFITFHSKKDADNKTLFTHNKAGGINLTNVFSLGIRFEDGEIKMGNLTTENESTVADIQQDYAKKVFTMGVITDASNNNLSALYTEGIAKEDVDYSVTFEAFDDEISTGNKYINSLDEEDGRVILNDDKDVTVTIKKDEITVGSIVYDIKDYKHQAVVVTKGNVSVNSDADFTGNIIALGKVSINGAATGSTKLTYNNDVTYRIYARNRDFFNLIFEKRLLAATKHIQIPGNVFDDVSSYNENKYIKKGLWQLVK